VTAIAMLAGSKVFRLLLLLLVVVNDEPQLLRPVQCLDDAGLLTL
jgi:hypothetical protein